MTSRIDSAVAAAFAIAFLCACGASAEAQTGAGEGKPKAVIGSHRSSAGHQLYNYAAAARSSVQPSYAWGAPPLQDPRDAYHGYFANPIDNPNYHGSADRR